jgi:hypothetical protein
MVFAKRLRDGATVTTVKRGNATGRVVLRVFGLKTEKTVKGFACESKSASPGEITVSGSAVETRIYGRSVRLETQFAALSRQGRFHTE